MKRSGFIRLFAVVILIAYLFLSLALSFSHGIEHNCAGEDCLICLFISAGERLLSVSSAVTVAFSSALIIFLASFTDRVGASVCRRTPVALKVKLSN